MRLSLRGRTRSGLLAFATGLALAPAALAAPRTYVLDASRSSVRVHVGKSGAFSFAGHTHEVAAPVASGEVVADAALLSASRVTLTFEAGTLKVLPEGEPAGDAPKVEDVMRGPKVLDASRFPSITFRSQKVTGRAGAGGTYDLEVTGEMSVHGVSKALTLPVHVELSGETLTATGKAVLRHDDFGMRPVSAGGGTVKVKNEIEVSYVFVGTAR